MAKTLQITNGTITVDLLGILDLAANGWSTKTASDGEGIWEIFEVVAHDTDANLRTEKAKFDRLIEQARVYGKKVYESVPVVLKWDSEGETAKQSLVLDGESEILADDIYSPLLGLNGGGAIMRLAVKRHPDWESATQTSGADNVSTLGGSFSLSLSKNGTAPGRIASLLIDNGPVTAQESIWCGIRPTRLGSAGFVSVWEAEDGTNFTDAVDAVDATASGGDRVTIDFATNADFAKRFTLRWGQVTGGNYDDIIGRYLVLGRVKLSSAATEVAVQLRHGFAGNIAGYETIVGTTYLSGVDKPALTDWNLVELGVVDIPPTGNRSGIVSATMDDYFLLLYAERLAGASLYFDCFVLIPAEHLFTAKGAIVDNSGNSLLNAYAGPDDFQTAVGVSGSALNYNCEFGFENWQFPIDGGLVVYASQALGLHSLSQDVDLLLTIAPRFKTFDG